MAKHTFPQTFEVSLPLREKREGSPLIVNGQTVAKGYTWVDVGREVGQVQVSIDVERLVHYIGARALRAKSGVSRLQNGSVEIRLVSRKREVRS